MWLYLKERVKNVTNHQEMIKLFYSSDSFSFHMINCGETASNVWGVAEKIWTECSTDKICIFPQKPYKYCQERGKEPRFVYTNCSR